VAEVPGVYLRTDTGRLEVFDHIDAAWNADAKTLTLSNPTKFDAKVQMLAEDSAQTKSPLPLEILSRCSVIEVPAGGTVSVAL